jgi:hippurate hydrolase
MNKQLLTGVVYSCCIVLLACVYGTAQTKKATIASRDISLIKKMANTDSLRLVELYKDLHQNPELGFMEIRTAGIVARELKALGYEVITGIAKTGVAGILKNGEGPVVMYRADMDCNSVKETTGLAYASTRIMKKEDGTETPVMHACGHDAHVTWMLGAAKIMANTKDNWSGTVVFLGQPAEEVLQGAQAMVKDGMYSKGVPVPDYLLGLHTWPIAVGSVINAAGERAAGSDQLDVTFYGVGGHGSRPEVAKDPIVMACNAVMQYQTIISRQIAAQDAAVLTVGAIHGGVDNNVIPPSAVVKLNLRWFTDKTRNVLLDGIKKINEAVAIGNDLPQELYPSLLMKSTVYPLVNDTALNYRINTALSSVIETNNILTAVPAMMGSEDFHHLVKEYPKTVYDYIKVGTANASMVAKAKLEGKDAPFYNHNGNYQVDLAAIPLGTVIGTTALMELLKK